MIETESRRKLLYRTYVFFNKIKNVEIDNAESDEINNVESDEINNVEVNVMNVLMSLMLFSVIVSDGVSFLSSFFCCFYTYT